MGGEIAWHTGRIDAEPAEVGYRPECLERLDAHFRELVESGRLQGASYLLSRGGKVFAWKSLGRLSYRGDKGDLMPDSIRGIASITKAFTAVCVMKLVEEGLLELFQPVASILDEFKTRMHERIQIFHLLTHTSGLAADPGYFTEAYPRGWREGFDPEKDNWIKAVLEGPVQNEPGEAFNYCSAGFAILGEVIARITGMPYEEYVRRKIFEPLGMERTFFDVPEGLHDQVCLVSEWDEKWLKDETDRRGWPPRAGGGIYSTLPDLWRFGQALLDKGTFNGQRILGRKMVEAMTRPQLGGGVPAFYWGARFKSYNYGLGLDLYTKAVVMSPGTFGHEGAGRSALYVDPAEGLVAVYFVPTQVDWVPESIVNPRAIIWSGII
ncbi:MAG: beta-lactamase family protein [Firmicutes bacterium]|nr:beta-lactamase family protein [Bacillota bacterium]